MLYDSLLLCAIIMVGTAFAIGARTVFSGAAIVAADPHGAVHGIFYQAFLLALCVGFFSYFWQVSGQTLGMQAWRIRAQGSDGSHLSFKQCLLRVAGGLLSWICLGLGFWVAWFRKDRRTWSDSLSNSVIVHVPGERKDALSGTTPQ